MELSRRRLIQLGTLGIAGAAFGGTAACSTSTAGGSGGGGNAMDMWYWADGLSKNVVDEAVKQFGEVTLKPQQIGGNFKEKLVTTMASGDQFVPDITGIKGEDFASFAPQADRFVNLLDLGAGPLAGQYLDWKWRKGMTKDGKLIGFPIDIGPTAMFYRRDVFAKAGLPAEPAQVAAQMSTWEDYFAAGVQLKKAVPNAFMVSEAWSVFNLVVGQSQARYIDQSERFIGDQEHIRRAWDLTVRAIQLGIDGKVQANTPDWNAGLAGGTIPSQTGPAWVAADLKSAAKDTTGKWGVALGPGGAANVGGSFLAVTKKCAKPDVAFKIISWILSPDNQAKGFTDSALFPSSPSTYTMPALTAPDPFFGGQVTTEVFGAAAKKIPVQYESPNDQAVSAPYATELTNVEANGKDPGAAWTDAVDQAKKIAQRLGVS
ncbi:cellobiose transport system substrate-binding protein [Kibdelosporangium banguiense]|uniref:Cellobiose transport system substrate-binding protein n=1 Tax=Kibdelosporangium banguiense TaxID=1365924 RepID=A0ABS4TQ13_9PSEU|nr:extracellular solute-binding protein [Kibdelosporangium banguiense]MBP2326494.1 cellobiose transport system substrate-binding protein [Kibdelosporangium banguiense]